jgi:hypothetical protein
MTGQATDLPASGKCLHRNAQKGGRFSGVACVQKLNAWRLQQLAQMFENQSWFLALT